MGVGWHACVPCAQPGPLFIGSSFRLRAGERWQVGTNRARHAGRWSVFGFKKWAVRYPETLERNFHTSLTASPELWTVFTGTPCTPEVY